VRRVSAGETISELSVVSVEELSAIVVETIATRSAMPNASQRMAA
jgi:hypothetical protein